MDFKFAFKDEVREIVDGSNLGGKINYSKLKGFYVYDPKEMIRINLNAGALRTVKVDTIIEEICVGIQHEYLHSAIRRIQMEEGTVEEWEPMIFYEEKLIADLVEEGFETENYKRILG